MPYSMDSEENKVNPTSPSPLMSLHEQLIYKLAALDASMQSGFRRLDEKMERFQSDLHSNQIDANDRINGLESDTRAALLIERNRIGELEKIKVGDLEKRIQSTETWQKIAVARTVGAMGVLTVMWALFGDSVHHLVQGIFK